VPTIDPRKLARLARAARQLGLTRLRVGADGSAEFDLAPEFDLGRPRPIQPDQEQAAPPPPTTPTPAIGSDAWLRKRFGRRN
jgi:hypothetical protein